jgi:excisionase family DNA binding protein
MRGVVAVPARTRRRQPSESTHVLTVDQVAAYLQLNRLTVYRYIREGKIPAAKIGKLYRVLKADVDGFLDTQKVGGPSTAHRRAAHARPAAATAPPTRQKPPEDVYVGPNWREQLRDREEKERGAPGYPLEWVMRGLH